jgi:hypothetical protein
VVYEISAGMVEMALALGDSEGSQSLCIPISPYHVVGVYSKTLDWNSSKKDLQSLGETQVTA